MALWTREHLLTKPTKGEIVEAMERVTGNSETACQGPDVLITELPICEPRPGMFLPDFAASDSSQCLLLTGSTLEHVRQRRLR
jgi:hypothetical protein